MVHEYPRSEVDRLVENFIDEVTRRPELLVEAYMALSTEALKEVLLSEVSTAPMSPMSQEMRRVVILFARERAETLGQEIQSED